MYDFETIKRYRVTLADGTMMLVVASNGGVVTEIHQPYRHLWGEYMPLVQEHLIKNGAKVEYLSYGEPSTSNRGV